MFGRLQGPIARCYNPLGALRKILCVKLDPESVTFVVVTQISFINSMQMRGPSSRTRSPGVCFKCRKPGHMARDCRSAGVGKRIGTCYFCGKLGHQQRECSAFKDAQVKVRRR